MFFFNDTATTEIYTLSLHDALPICGAVPARGAGSPAAGRRPRGAGRRGADGGSRPGRHGRSCPHHAPPAVAQTGTRSEEHTSELQSRQYLVCRLLLEKKKNTYT